MKVFVVIFCLSLLTSVYSQDRQDCKLHGAPELTLEYGQAFSIPEACLLLKCRGGNNFEVVSGCPTIFRGAPGDVAAKKSKEMGEKILAGEGCSAISVV